VIEKWGKKSAAQPTWSRGLQGSGGNTSSCLIKLRQVHARIIHSQLCPTNKRSPRLTAGRVYVQGNLHAGKMNQTKEKLFTITILTIQKCNGIMGKYVCHDVFAWLYRILKVY